jgi:hypothetical protein
MRMIRVVARAALFLLIGLAMAYAIDWIVFGLRLSHGNAMGTVKVQQFLKTPLKGNKLEYDYLGSADASCSQTLFPQYAASTWNPPCWWLARHKTQWESVQLELPGRVAESTAVLLSPP